MTTIRKAQPEDIQEIVDLTNQVFRSPSTGLIPTMGLQFPLFLSERNARNLFIAEEDGRIVAHNGIMPNTIVIDGCCISMASMGAVCTHPDHRGKGLGTKILHAVLASLHDEGVGLLTISGGRGLYTRNGAVHTAGKKEFTLVRNGRGAGGGGSLEDGDSNRDESIEGGGRTGSRSDEYCGDAGNQVDSGLLGLLSVSYHQDRIPSIVDEMADLYRAEPVRYLRARWEFPILLEAAPAAHDVQYPPDSVVASCRIGQCLIAYIIGYRKKGGELRVYEYAGDRLAVGFLLRRMLSDLDAQRLVLDVPSHDRLASYLERCGFSGKSMPYPSTFIVTNVTVLWDQVRPAIQERLCEHDTESSLDRLPIDVDDSGELIHFLFDDYERKAYGQPWDSILPLPLPSMEGLNYI